MTWNAARALYLRIQQTNGADWEPVSVVGTGDGHYAVRCRDRFPDAAGALRFYQVERLGVWEEHRAALAAAWNRLAAPVGLPRVRA